MLSHSSSRSSSSSSFDSDADANNPLELIQKMYKFKYDGQTYVYQFFKIDRTSDEYKAAVANKLYMPALKVFKNEILPQNIIAVYVFDCNFKNSSVYYLSGYWSLLEDLRCHVQEYFAENDEDASVMLDIEDGLCDYNWNHLMTLNEKESNDKVISYNKLMKRIFV